MNNKAFGEIIESSLGHWRGQSWQWDYFPRFASLVIVDAGSLKLVGLIYEVKTGSADSTREPYAYQKTEEELRQQQPHIFSFLKTTFSCSALGFIENNKLYFQIPPIPPKIHAFVEHASAHVAQQCFTDPSFMVSVAHTPAAPMLVDELLLAIIKEQVIAGNLTQAQLTDILEQYSLMYGHDYRRLKQLSARLLSLSPFHAMSTKETTSHV